MSLCAGPGPQDVPKDQSERNPGLQGRPVWITRDNGFVPGLTARPDSTLDVLLRLSKRGAEGRHKDAKEKYQKLKSFHEKRG